MKSMNIKLKNKKNITIIVVLAVILFIWSYFWYIKYEDYKCMSYNKDSNLSAETKLDFENKLKSTIDRLNNYTWSLLDSERFNLFIAKSRYNQYLWNYCEAIKILNQVKIEFWSSSSLVFNNLASIYEELWEYKKAIENYLIIINTPLDNYSLPYYKKIIQDYVELKDYDKAKEFYYIYEKNWWKRDMDLINRVKKIKK